MPRAGLDFNVELDGADRVAQALRDAQPKLKERTVPVMQRAAADIARGAMFRARQEPKGLWARWSRARHGYLSPASPRYVDKKKGEYWFRVETPGSAAGRAEAVSEFARLAVKPQGAALVRTLDSLYGRPGGSGGGRILWAAADDASGKIVSDIVRAAAQAAADIEREMGEA